MIARVFIFLGKIFLLSSILIAIILSIVIYYFSLDLPSYDKLKQYYPSSSSRIYSIDGKLIARYGREHRVFAPIKAIPKILVLSFVASEDKNFYRHSGIDFLGIIRAALRNLYYFNSKKSLEGGSTIPQQVVKNFLLDKKKSYIRKLKEAILAYRITKVFSKDQIMELYLNDIYLGKGAYGVASAALVYFNKSIDELTLNESAVLASLPKSPSKFTLKNNRAFLRKNYVLKRMYEDGYITTKEYLEAIKEPIKLSKFTKVQPLKANYYANKVVQEVLDMFGEEYFYTEGLTIITCLDSKIQRAATQAVQNGAIKHDMKEGYRGPITKIELINWQDQLRSMSLPLGGEKYQLAVILTNHEDFAQIGLHNGDTNKLHLKDLRKWGKKSIKSVSEILNVGDVILVETVGSKYLLKQIPEINAGIMVLDNRTGAVLASEGGINYNKNQFDLTIHANRQPGSLIKPFVYLAALEQGARPNDIFEDEPIEIEQGPNLPLWKPRNFERNFIGPLTLRQGLEKSRNIITIKVGQVAGINKVAQVIKRFGINDNPRLLESIVLGVFETTLSKMVIAFSTLANYGKKVEPHYIELIKDRKGNVIYRRDFRECSECRYYTLDDRGKIVPPNIGRPDGNIILDEANSYQMISLLSGAVQRGTARRSKVLNKILAAKTGTTNDVKDTWFIGFTPEITVGVFVGYDVPKTINQYASGGTIAQPFFIDFMQRAYKDTPSIDFLVPDSIELLPIDYKTGEILSSPTKSSIFESFKKKDYNYLL